MTAGSCLETVIWLQAANVLVCTSLRPPVQMDNSAIAEPAQETISESRTVPTDLVQGQNPEREETVTVRPGSCARGFSIAQNSVTPAKNGRRAHGKA